MKLEVGKTYLTSTGQQHTMNDVQEYKSWYFATFRLYREKAGTDENWAEDGRHSSGADELRLIMEMPVAAVEELKRLSPSAPVVADAGDDIQLFAVNWTKRTVSPK